MPKTKTNTLSDRDWDNLVRLAAGYLPMTGGDIRKAMAKAMAAHYDLIAAAKEGSISSDISQGRVTLMVPDTGGIALKIEPH